jgi:hypothetical protein
MSESKAGGNLDSLRKAATEALRSHDVLLNAWRALQDSDIAEATEEDVDLLRSLIVSRIYPVNAFSMLVKVDQSRAIEVLLSRYLGVGVCPDRKFGGFESELGIMLDDLEEFGGRERIIQLVRHPEFAVERTEDSRVCRAFGEILNLDERLVPDWIETQRRAV